MKDAFIHLRVAEADKSAFDQAVQSLEKKLGTGATASNVLLLMMRALVSAVEAGKKPLFPFECRTEEEKRPTLQYPEPSSTAPAPARVAESGERYCVRKSQKSGKTGSA